MSTLNAIINTHSQPRKLRLILHAGATKTGTSSLQFYLDENRRELTSKGVLYPTEGTKDSNTPKHQWIVSALMTGNEELFSSRLSKCFDECDDHTHTIVLSTEGIYNHWWDYSMQSKKQLEILASHFDLSCVIWLREPISFFKSLYIQLLKNPRVNGIDSYGHDLSPEEVLKMPWAARQLHYDALLQDMREVMGSDNVFSFSYTPHFVEEFYQLLGLSAPKVEFSRKNVSSLTSTGVQILRIINRFPLSHEKKQAGYELISQINSLIDDSENPFELDQETIRYIQSISSATIDSLREMHESSLLRWNVRYAGYNSMQKTN